MPDFLPNENRLCNSFAEMKVNELGHAGKATLWLVDTFKLAKVERPTMNQVRLSNLTIINYVLYVCGPMHEASLTMVLLCVQTACNVLALIVRYQLAGLFYDIVR